MDDEHGWAAMFAAQSGHLLSDATEPVTFQRVVDGAVAVVPGCDDCGITLRQRRGRSASVAATSERARTADSLQHTLGEGPCLDAAFTTEVCHVRDLGAETRWPAWTRGALRAGIRSVLSLRLHTEAGEIGAVNLYASAPRAFDTESVDLAVIYAAHAARALDQARVVSGLQVALQSRHDIGVAQGMLAVTYGISVEEAFAVLQRYSSETNTRLHAVARQVVETRRLPPPG